MECGPIDIIIIGSLGSGLTLGFDNSSCSIGTFGHGRWAGLKSDFGRQDLSGGNYKITGFVSLGG